MINSRNKGAVGEREFAEFLRGYGVEARRGQQFKGGPGSPDVVTTLTDVHFEVKRVEAGNPYKWLAQAIKDAGDKTPIVAHRKSREEWIAILPMSFLIQLLCEVEGYQL